MVGWLALLALAAAGLAFAVPVVRRLRADSRGLAGALEESRTMIAALRCKVEECSDSAVSVERQLEHLLHRVSHDLRAPLRAIDGFAGILQEDYADRLDEEAHRCLRVVRDNAAKLDRMLDGLQAWSHAGLQPVTLVTVDMAELVRRAIEEVCTSQGGVRPEVIIHDLPCVRADRSLLYQVWYRLLENAVIRARTNASSRIEIGGQLESRAATCYVHDNGVGLHKRNEHEVCGAQRYLYREGDFPGAGVDLSIVERIVTRHGGRVWVEEAPEQGARISFSLPAA